MKRWRWVPRIAYEVTDTGLVSAGGKSEQLCHNDFWGGRGHVHDAHVCLGAPPPRYVLAFAVGCVLSSAYGFIAGAWPFGVVELIWAAVDVRRYVGLRTGPSIN